MDTQQIAGFWLTLNRFYEEQGRHDMAWRQPDEAGEFDAYKILVSEIMLQQTQVSRVEIKYAAFLAQFPTIGSLASASLGEVLQLWTGLGYNRRAKFLWQAAQAVQSDFGGIMPHTLPELQQLPGVGPNTAGAIMAYAYDQPVVYLETNIRTVMIHHFFHDETGISDAVIREKLAAVLAQASTHEDMGISSPRQFYWAMMDYGAYLKRTVGNLNRASKSYAKQSAFHGSRRQLRGQIIRLLTEHSYTLDEIMSEVNDARCESVLVDLTTENMILQTGSEYRLS